MEITFSATGIGLGWVVVFSNALSFAIGAVIAYVWGRINRKTHDAFNFRSRPASSPASRC